MTGVVILRAFALVLLAIGGYLTWQGGYLLRLGGSPYYVICGLVVIVSAVLLFLRRAEGVMIYGAMLLASLAWGISEAGANGWALMPRVAAPAVLGLVLLIPAVRRSVIRRAAPWAWPRVLVTIVGAMVLGIGLRVVAPPHLPLDPLYQAGIGTAPAAQPVSASADDWLHYGNDQGGTRYSSLAQITTENVKGLKPAWTFNTGITGSRLQTTPLKIGDTLYICTGTNDIIALDAESGEQRWRFDAHANRDSPWTSCRGVTYYKSSDISGACAERILTNTVDARLIAVDAKDGKPCADFGTNGEVSLLVGMGDVPSPGYYFATSAPTLARGKVVIGGWVGDNQYWGEPSGVIRAFDAVTGKLAWAWDMGQPDRTGEPAPGETYTPSTPNAWAPMSADESLGLVYVPLGNPTPDFFGGHRRHFDEQYNDALVALDIDTGRPRWHFQTLRHDVWDLDIPAQPTLVDIPMGGEIKRAVVQPTKRGELFVLDRATGAPLFPLEERPVPQRGAVPEELLSPTQSYVVGMPSFRGADLVEHAMWGITPLDQLWCRIKFKEARYDGAFTPPGLDPAISTPGSGGGMEWGGVAVDVARNVAVINTNIWPIYFQLIPRAVADQMGVKPFGKGTSHLPFQPVAPQANTPYAARANTPFFSPLGVPCMQPPYGRLSAVDLSTGKLIWTQAFGTAREVGPLGIRSQLPLALGTFNMGGAVVTQGGLFFIGAAQDKRFRAYETATGRLLWDAPLPGGGVATPMTYMSKSGRQFVVIAASGSDGIHTAKDDHLVAYALPDSSAGK